MRRYGKIKCESYANGSVESEKAAEEYALYLQGCTQEGAGTLHMSNPGDYDYDEKSFSYPSYEIVETDD